MKLKKKTEQRMFNTLAKMLSKDNISKLESQLVYRETDGTYNMFGEYTICKREAGYLLEKTHTFTTIIFSELKNATTWATLDKLNRVIESNRVLELDIQLAGATENMKVHDKLCKGTKDLDKKTVYLNKLNEDRVKKRRINAELEDFVKKAKAWQYQQFEKNPMK